MTSSVLTVINLTYLFDWDTAEVFPNNTSCCIVVFIDSPVSPFSGNPLPFDNPQWDWNNSIIYRYICQRSDDENPLIRLPVVVNIVMYRIVCKAHHWHKVWINDSHLITFMSLLRKLKINVEIIRFARPLRLTVIYSLSELWIAAVDHLSPLSLSPPRMSQIRITSQMFSERCKLSKNLTRWIYGIRLHGGSINKCRWRARIRANLTMHFAK